VEELLDPGPETYKRFLVEWHGPWRPEYGVSPGETKSRTMPAPLREFLEFAGNWPRLAVQNHVLHASEMRIQDEKLVFYVENQGVCDWATMAAEADDPPVWVREDYPGEPWLEEERLSRFLLQLVVFETVMGAAQSASAVDLPLETAEQLMRRLHELPLNPWHWPVHPTRFFAGDRVLLIVGPGPRVAGRLSEQRGPEDDPLVWLFAGALDADALAFFADHVDDEAWEYFTPRDGPRRVLSS
jgi:hypothetical protein